MSLQALESLLRLVEDGLDAEVSTSPLTAETLGLFDAELFHIIIN